MTSGYRFALLAGLAGVLVSGCASSRQLAPAASSGGPAPGKALVRVHRSGSIAGGAMAFNVSDNERIIGYLGPGGDLVWEREPGLIILSAWVADRGAGMPGSEAGITRIVDRVEAGRSYSYGLSLDMMKARGVKIVAAQPVAPPPRRVTVLIHPTIDARADKALKLEEYGGHFELARKTGRGHLTTLFADDWMERTTYLDRAYLPAGDASALSLADVLECDRQKLERLPKGDADYLFVAVVRDFHDELKVLWTIRAAVECFLFDLRTNELVWRNSGTEQTTADPGGKAGRGLGQYRSGVPGLVAALGKDNTLETERDPWLRAMAHATRNALSTMPVLTARSDR